MATSHHLPTRRTPHDRRVTFTTWAAVLVMAAAWMWIHQTASAGPQDAPLDNPSAPQARPMPVWLAQSQPLLDGLVVARNDIAAAAARRDLPATGAACQAAAHAAQSLHQQLPSPDPMVNSTLHELLRSYDLGLPYCISASKTHDSGGLQKAADYLSDGDTAMRSAINLLGCKPAGQGVLIV
jgi:hypothetical protein